MARLAPDINQIQVINSIPLFLENARIARETAVVNCLLIWRESMVNVLSGPGRGRLYTHKGHTHRASAPGDPPAIEFGELAGSISWASHGMWGMVGTPLAKGLTLERGNQRIAPRPFIERSFQANRQHIMSLLASRWDVGGMNLGRGNVRTLLYGAGRLLGDVSFISGGIEGMSGIRTGLYTSGKVLGDVGAIRGGTIPSRLVSRSMGQSAQPLVGMSPGGRVGRRVSGRATGIGLRQIQSL